MGRSIVIGAREGSRKYMYDGENGGQVSTYGGAAQGPNWDNDHGGNISISGYYAKKAKGGSVQSSQQQVMQVPVARVVE
eukprot:7764707-Ditylum_brightwellii.AAC.1